jgi:RNA polymerase sigma-70 factor (ECF subfamily)
VSDHHAVFPRIYGSERGIHSDDQIVLALREGSAAAFTELHRIYSRRLYRVIFAITRNPEDADDALQDTFLRAYRGIQLFEGRSTIYSWLTRIAINSALMVLRKRRVRSEVVVDLQPDGIHETFSREFQDPSLSPEEVCNLRQRLARVRRAIDNLEPQLREPLRMRIEQESSIEEICQVLQITSAAVKARLHRARRQLSARPDLKRLMMNHRRLPQGASKRDAERLDLDLLQML